MAPVTAHRLSPTGKPEAVRFVISKLQQMWDDWPMGLKWLMGTFLILASCGSNDEQTRIDAGSTDGPVAINDAALADAAPLCPSFCGSEELCEEQHKGVDDNCDGVVDEGCECFPGEIYSCFRGDPAQRNTAGCVDGSMQCGDLGFWGECVGGLHASDDCSEPGICQAVTSLPFVPVDLSAGTVGFSGNAKTEIFSVVCPTGIAPCTTPIASNFTALQSGEYSVRYRKVTSNGTDECTFPLFVGAPGLRAELEWEWDESLGTSTVDLDLRLHKPNDTTGWGGAADCAFDNCTVDAFDLGSGVDWFGDNSWLLDPVLENNSCYFGPNGSGARWQSLGMGCHSPRLDSDNVTCMPSVTDPANFSFCNAENSNIDRPPTDAWTRVAVHYYSNQDQSYDVHPRLKIYCEGRLAADLGPQGFGGSSSEAVTFAASFDDGYWLAADVLFPSQSGDCAPPACIVRPLYADEVARSPVFLPSAAEAAISVGPEYAPIP